MIYTTEAPDLTPVVAYANGARRSSDLHLHFAPGVDRTESIAGQILSEIGCDSAINGRARNGMSEADLAPLWLMAHEYERVLLWAADSVAPRAIRQLIEVVAPAGVDLVLLGEHGCAATLTQRILARGKGDAVVRIALSEAITHEPEQPSAPNTEDGRSLLGFLKPQPFDTGLPNETFLTFLHSCRRILNSEQFEQVEVLYRAGEAAGLQALESASPTEQGTHDLIREVCGRHLDTADATCVVRGLQTAYLRNGWLLQIDDLKLWSALTYRRPRTVTPAQWDRLRVYRDPERAAVIALYLLGVDYREIPKVTIRHVRRYLEGHLDALAQKRDTPWAHPYLRCQMLVRALDGAIDDDPLVPVANARRVPMDLAQAARDIGLNLPTSGKDADVTARWADLLGFRITRLEESR